MKHKLKSGLEIELTEHDIKEIVKIYQDEDDDHSWEKYHQFLKKYHERARVNLEIVADEDITDEKDIKQNLECLLKCGSYHEVAEFLYELSEFQSSKMLIDMWSN